MPSFALDLSLRPPIDHLNKDDNAIADFIHQYFTAIDILYPSSPASELAKFFKSGAEFIMNGGPGASLDKVFGMLEMRTKMLSAFTHTGDKMRVSWTRDGNGNGNYVVVCEGVSRTTFAKDPEQEAIPVHECNILDLEEAPPGKGVHGLWVARVRTYMDPRAVESKAKSVMEL